jgi:hypothetical protein
LSTRARITATSFTNSYEWGDFKGDPAKLMERWFDLHLYVANWGSRLIDRDPLDVFLGKVDCADLKAVGEKLILDITRDEVPSEDWDDGSGRLAALSPLRADVLSGDLRLFYLLWLTAVEADAVGADVFEPLSGIGPMTGALEAFAGFFGIGRDLVQAVGERPAVANSERTSSDAARKAIGAMPDRQKTALLVRLFDGDPHVASEWRAAVRKSLEPKSAIATPASHTVRELRFRADAVRVARDRAEAERAAEERPRSMEAAEKARMARLETLRRRGEWVWKEVEDEIERRNAASYGKVVALLSDLCALAEKQRTMDEFHLRLDAMRERHTRKGQFIKKLAAIG